MISGAEGAAALRRAAHGYTAAAQLLRDGALRGDEVVDAYKLAGREVQDGRDALLSQLAQLDDAARRETSEAFLAGLPEGERDVLAGLGTDLRRAGFGHGYVSALTQLGGNDAAMFERLAQTGDDAARNARRGADLLERLEAVSGRVSDHPVLASTSRGLVAEARAAGPDQIVGRDDEVAALTEALLLRQRGVAVLSGPAGVGKRSVVQALAERIAAGSVPSPLRDVELALVDVGELRARARGAGELQAQVDAIFAELRSARGSVIPVFSSRGAFSSGVPGAAELRAAIERAARVDGARAIIALPDGEAAAVLDSPLGEHAVEVAVAPGNRELAERVLAGQAPMLQQHANLGIEPGVIEATARLAERYAPSGALPGSAVDLLDMAASRAQVRAVGAAGQGTDASVQLADVDAVVQSAWGVPTGQLHGDGAARLLGIEEAVGQRVLGQDEVVRRIGNGIRAQADSDDGRRIPAGFLLTGSSGSGKTETLRALAQHLFGDEKAIIRIDGSEYMERHAVSRLTGPPPGYEGYDAGGQLTEAVRKRRHSIILIDEGDKMHPDAFNVLLQVLGDGRLTDGKGRTVDFSDTIVAVTGNWGRDQLNALSAAGASAEQMDEAANVALKGALRSEVIGRFTGGVLVYRPPTEAVVERIADLNVERMVRRQAARGLELEVTPAARADIAARGYQPEFGARPVLSILEGEVAAPLATMRMSGTVPAGSRVIIDASEHGPLQVRVAPDAGSVA